VEITDTPNTINEIGCAIKEADVCKNRIICGWIPTDGNSQGIHIFRLLNK
jgi:hypothetical protein